MTTTTTTNPLDLLNAALEALGKSPHDYEHTTARDEFRCSLIGALSSSVDPDVWRSCLATATRCVEESHERRAAA